MKTATIRFTKSQIEEIYHKIEVMLQDGCEEGNMAHHYGFTDETLDALSAKFRGISHKARYANVELNEREAIAVEGELENAQDIAESNIGDPNDEYYIAARRFQDGRDRIVAAFPELFN